MKQCFDFEPKWRRSFSSPVRAEDATTQEELYLLKNKLVQTAIHLFLVRQIHPNIPAHVDVDILSAQNRGITLAGFNEDLKTRNVIRVSRPSKIAPIIVTAKDISGPTQCSERILAFGQFMMEHGKNIAGIVPFIHRPLLLPNGFLIEQYQEITCSSPQQQSRIDLHTFVMENMDGDNARTGFSYLHDVLCGIVELHRHGWAHMDVSLENVAISDDHAFLVDFESVLPFYTEDRGALKRRDIGVPLKSPFVPPEHYMSRKNDLLHLPSYDVWAFGIMFFTVLFREYLFALRTVTDPATGNQFMMPVSAQIRFFMANGFVEFCRKYHTDKYMLMFETSRVRCKMDAPVKLDARVSEYLQMCGDLLSKIFERPNVVVIPDDSCDVVPVAAVAPTLSNNSNKTKTTKSRKPVYFCTCDRFTAQDVYDHPFWEAHGIR